MSDSEWNLYKPNEAKIYEINTFDDGNEKYQQFTNEWLFIGEWRGKVRLVNRENRKIIISSISRWKVGDMLA
jgi:hypothetical protein